MLTSVVILALTFALGLVVSLLLALGLLALGLLALGLAISSALGLALTPTCYVNNGNCVSGLPSSS